VISGDLNADDDNLSSSKLTHWGLLRLHNVMESLFGKLGSKSLKTTAGSSM